MRDPVLALSWLKRTVLRLTALYSLTGTVTSPKLMAPVQIERGMDRQVCPTGGVLHTSRRHSCAVCYAFAPSFSKRSDGLLPSWRPSANSPTLLALNASRPPRLRAVTRAWSTTTCASTHVPPALRMSVCSDGQDVTVRPRTTSASTSVHGA